MDSNDLVTDLFATLLLQLMEDGKEYLVEVDTELYREKFNLYKIDGEIKILQNKDFGSC